MKKKEIMSSFTKVFSYMIRGK